MVLTYFLISLLAWIPCSVAVMRYFAEVSSWDHADGEDKFFSLLFGGIASIFWPIALLAGLALFVFRFAFKLTEPK